VDERLFDGAKRSVEQATDAYFGYVARQLVAGVPLHAMTRHMLGLFNGRRGARQFRRHLSENATRPGAGIDVLRDALAFVAQPDACAV
jgi:tRNA-dihydrouridine synthase A